MDGIEARKRFSRSRRQGFLWNGGPAHTVDDGTNDLVNLSNGRGLSAGHTGQGREAIGLRLESATGDGGRSGKSSPPEGPGKTAVTRGKEMVSCKPLKGLKVDKELS